MHDDVFMKKYAKLVYHFVEKIFGHRLNLIKKETSLDKEDLTQYGMEGLIKARRDFKPELGFKFITYAVPRIVGEIKRAIRSSQKVRITKEVYEIKGKIFRGNLREKDIKAIAKILGSYEHDVKTALEYDPILTSLQKPVGKWSDGRIMILEDILEDKTTSSIIDKVVEEIVITDFLRTIDEREQLIWYMHAENIQQSKIGKHFGLSQVQISRILTGIYVKAEDYGKQHKLHELHQKGYVSFKNRKSRESKYGNWLDIAEENGISKGAFWYRLREGWTCEMAATHPTGNQGMHHKKKQII
ncbi:sigma-70 family RNA polymerase sigma factor [Bacillus thuringiensis]|uniref:sigma-70 family RNA polymerase sigma factor n=1 Tax=Bacillus thuringiensis TaxID=1428 RepID=UPI0039880D87